MAKLSVTPFTTTHITPSIQGSMDLQIFRIILKLYRKDKGAVSK